MKIAASNIAWGAEDDEEVYAKMQALGFSCLEIAPTRLVPQPAYSQENIRLAVALAKQIQTRWEFPICSMQSLWFGITERIFGTPDEREFLLHYMYSALDFSAAVGCPHVVFGSPRNRVIDHPDQLSLGEVFFSACAEYAQAKGVVIGLEANPAVYGTNYLNTTMEAWELIKKINSPSLRLNLDLGTVLINHESLDILPDVISYVSHVHISEPGLAPLQPRQDHLQLAQFLRANNYQGCVSLEMKNSGKKELFSSMEIMSDIFA
ncbi:Xylose isomerase-like TIM barrel [compost metagenome]